MKAAFSAWDDRIAPVFDVARRIILVETKGGRIITEKEETFGNAGPLQKGALLADMGVDVLVCGAVSRPLQEMIAAYGIRVIPFVAGEVRQVIDAWLAGKREIDFFVMPGCCRRKRGMPEKRGTNEEVLVMRGRGGGAMGRGKGAGRGGRMGGPATAGPGEYCLCPQCGNREIHQAGIPCLQMQCPKCGSTMVRE
jgi:predicted Fe-Mo cluster-binding NifX family protein